MKGVSEVDFLRVAIRSRCMVVVLKRAFHRFSGVTMEAAAAFRAYDCRESFRFNPVAIPMGCRSSGRICRHTFQFCEPR